MIVELLKTMIKGLVGGALAGFVVAILNGLTLDALL